MTINIRTTNAAFYNDDGRPDQHAKAFEIARILSELADKLQDGWYPARGEPWPLYDVNGNKVGTVRR